MMLRTEALMKFSSPSGNRTGILVTYPEALSEKVALPSTLSANLISVKTGDELDVYWIFILLAMKNLTG